MVSFELDFKDLERHKFLKHYKNQSLQFYRAFLQELQSAIKFGHKVANFEELDSLNKTANPLLNGKDFESRETLHVNFQNLEIEEAETVETVRLAPLVSDYYLSLWQGKSVFWINQLSVSQQVEANYGLFESNSFEQEISSQLSRHFPLIVGDFRTPLQEKFERGYQQVSEKLEVEIDGFFGKIPNKIVRKNWMKWLVSALSKLEDKGNLCFIAPLDLAESESCLGIRKKVAELFGEAEIKKHLLASKPFAVYKFTGFKKTLGGVGEKPADYKSTFTTKVQNIDSQEFSISDTLSSFNVKTWLSQSESNYFDGIPLMKSKQNGFGFFLFEPKKANDKSPKITFTRNNNDFYFLWNDGRNENYIESTHEFQKLTSKAVSYFQKFYEKQLEIPKYLETDLLKAQLKEISRFSKQLPVLHKLSEKLTDKIPKGKSNKVPISESESILEEIENYASKIKQLAKGANERKTTFALMQKHLRTMKANIDSQLENEKQLLEKLAKVNEESVFHYIHAVLNNPTTQKQFARIHQNYLPRVALFHDFWVWSELGGQLAESLETNEQINQFVGNWELEEEASCEIEIGKLTFDVRNQKAYIDGKLIVSEIPEDVFLPKLGKTHLVKHLAKQLSNPVSKNQLNQILTVCRNYWQVLEKIRILGEESKSYNFNYNSDE